MRYYLKRQYNGQFALIKNCEHGGTLIFTDMDYTLAKIELRHKRAFDCNNGLPCPETIFCKGRDQWNYYMKKPV